MPKGDFRSVVIREDLYWKLVEKAIEKGVSPHDLLWRLLAGENVDRSGTRINKLSDVGLDVVFTEDNKQGNALSVVLDSTDHIDFKCATCGASLLLTGINHSDFIVEFYYLCPVCLKIIYTKYNQPLPSTALWNILSNKTLRVKFTKSNEAREIVEELHDLKREFVNYLAMVIVKSALISLNSYDLVEFSKGAFKIPLNINDTLKSVFTHFAESGTMSWTPFNFKFIPYYSKHIGKVFRYESGSLVVPKDIFVEILTDLLLKDVLIDLKPASMGHYVVFSYSLKSLPTELLFPITTEKSPQRYLVLKPFINLYREFKYHFCIKDEHKKVKEVLEITQAFGKIDKEEFVRIFGCSWSDRIEKQVLAYLELVDQGIIFLEYENRVYILVDREQYGDVLKKDVGYKLETGGENFISNDPVTK